MNIISIASEISDFYRGYIRSFNDDDFKLYCACFAAGSITIKANSQVISGTPEDIGERATILRRRLKSEGWQITRIRASRVWPIEERLGLIASDLERINQAGEVYEVARCLYSVAKADDGWKIWSMVVSTAPLSASDELVNDRSSGGMH